MGWFSTEVNKKFVKIMDMIALSLLWVLFSVPVFTIGAATSALYYSYHNLYVTKNDDRIFSTFFKGFKLSFRQATTVFVSYFLLLFSCNYYLSLISQRFPFLDYFKIFFSIILIFVFGGSLLFTLIQIARFNQTIRQCLKNAISFTVIYPIRTLAILFLIILVTFLIWLFPFFVLIGPLLISALISNVFEKIFKSLI